MNTNRKQQMKAQAKSEDMIWEIIANISYTTNNISISIRSTKSNRQTEIQAMQIYYHSSFIFA